MSDKSCKVEKPKKPCAVLDEVGPGKGYKLALFDPKTDRLQSFLVSDAEGCRTTKKREDATTFASIKEVEAAINKCRALPCPP
jgi:hypothetical protein